MEMDNETGEKVLSKAGKTGAMREYVCCITGNISYCASGDDEYVGEILPTS